MTSATRTTSNPCSRRWWLAGDSSPVTLSPATSDRASRADIAATISRYDPERRRTNAPSHSPSSTADPSAAIAIRASSGSDSGPKLLLCNGLAVAISSIL